MNRRNAPILVLFSIITLFSTLLYSCETNQAPAYVGTWINYDSSEFKSKNGQVNLMIWNFSESNASVTYSTKDASMPNYVDSSSIAGNITIFSQFVTIKFSSLWVLDPATNNKVTLTDADPMFNKVLDECLLDSTSEFSFKINQGVMLLTNEDTTYILRRQ